MQLPNPLLLFVLGAIGLGGAILTAYRFRFAFVLLAGLLFVASIAAPLDWTGRPIRTWLTPVQQIRSYLFAGLGIMLYVSLLVHLPRLSLRRYSAQSIILLFIGLYEGLLRLLTFQALEGTTTIALRLFVVAPAAWLIPALISQRRDWTVLLRMVCIVAIGWIGVSTVQFVLDPSVLSPGGGGRRFQGMLSNPQHAAVFLAYAVVISLYLALNDYPLKLRPIWTGLAAVSLVLMLWTGSRTGMAMCLMGMMIVLYPRLKGAILVMPIAAAAFYIALRIIQGAGLETDFSRLTSIENTRGASWVGMIKTIAQNPLLGTGVTERGLAGGSENSLLFGTATFGLGMGFLILILMTYSAVIVMRLWKYRQYMDTFDRRLTDLIIAGNLMYLGGSFFEGYILARVGSPLVLLLIFGAMGTRMIAVIRDGTHLPDHEHALDEFEDHESGDDYGHYDQIGQMTDDLSQDSH